MGELGAEEEAVARHYDEAIFAYEAERLTTHSAVEFAITARYLTNGASWGGS